MSDENQVEEFERSIGDGAYEWSIPTAPDPGRNFRLFVSTEPVVSRLLSVEECPVTSSKPGARRLEVDDPALHRSVKLTLDEARWLIRTLPKAIAQVEAAWADAETEPAPARPKLIEVVHACLWSAQPDILIACDHSWTTPSWDKRTAEEAVLYAAGVYKAVNGRYYTFDEPEVTCQACLETLADPVKRRKAGTP